MITPSTLCSKNNLNSLLTWKHTNIFQRHRSSNLFFHALQTSYLNRQVGTKKERNNLPSERYYSYLDLSPFVLSSPTVQPSRNNLPCSPFSIICIWSTTPFSLAFKRGKRCAHQPCIISVELSYDRRSIWKNAAGPLCLSSEPHSSPRKQLHLPTVAVR